MQNGMKNSAPGQLHFHLDVVPFPMPPDGELLSFGQVTTSPWIHLGSNAPGAFGR